MPVVYNHMSWVGSFCLFRVWKTPEFQQQTNKQSHKRYLSSSPSYNLIFGLFPCGTTNLNVNDELKCLKILQLGLLKWRHNHLREMECVRTARCSQSEIRYRVAQKKKNLMDQGNPSTSSSPPHQMELFPGKRQQSAKKRESVARDSFPPMDNNRDGQAE